jgi:hypothetical protein
MVSSDKLAEIKQRYRDDPNMYWVSEVDWLLAEVERLTIDNRCLTEMWATDRETLTAEVERWREVVKTFSAGNVALEAENERLQDLLAECFPLVRPGTDLNSRLRIALGSDG